MNHSFSFFCRAIDLHWDAIGAHVSTPALFTVLDIREKFSKNKVVDDYKIQRFATRDLLFLPFETHAEMAAVRAAQNKFIGQIHSAETLDSKLFREQVHNRLLLSEFTHDQWIRSRGGSGESVFASRYETFVRNRVADDKSEGKLFKAAGLLHESADMVLAFLLQPNLPGRIHRRYEHNRVSRCDVSPVPNSHTINIALRAVTAAIDARRGNSFTFRCSLAFKFQRALSGNHDAWFLACTPRNPKREERKDYSGGGSSVVGDRRPQPCLSSLFVLEAVTPRVCRFTYYQDLDLNGFVGSGRTAFPKVFFCNTVDELFERFSRNNTAVEREIRASFSSAIVHVEEERRPEERAISERQREILTRCKGLEAEFKTKALTRVPTKGPSIKMWRVASEVPMLKSESIMDTSPEVVLGWLWDGCSVRTKWSPVLVHPEDVVGIEVSELGFREKAVASVFCFPFPMNTRECARTMIWEKAEDGSYIIAVTNSDEIVDYSAHTKLESMTTKHFEVSALFKVEPLSEIVPGIRRSKLTVFNKYNPFANILSFGNGNSYTRRLLTSVDNIDRAVIELSRSKDIDSIMWNAVVDRIRDYDTDSGDGEEYNYDSGVYSSVLRLIDERAKVIQLAISAASKKHSFTEKGRRERLTTESARSSGRLQNSKSTIQRLGSKLSVSLRLGFASSDSVNRSVTANKVQPMITAIDDDDDEGVHNRRPSMRRSIMAFVGSAFFTPFHAMLGFTSDIAVPKILTMMADDPDVHLNKCFTSERISARPGGTVFAGDTVVDGGLAEVSGWYFLEGSRERQAKRSFLDGYDMVSDEETNPQCRIITLEEVSASPPLLLRRKIIWRRLSEHCVVVTSFTLGKDDDLPSFSMPTTNSCSCATFKTIPSINSMEQTRVSLVVQGHIGIGNSESWKDVLVLSLMRKKFDQQREIERYKRSVVWGQLFLQLYQRPSKADLAHINRAKECIKMLVGEEADKNIKVVPSMPFVRNAFGKVAFDGSPNVEWAVSSVEVRASTDDLFAYFWSEMTERTKEHHDSYIMHEILEENATNSRVIYRYRALKELSIKRAFFNRVVGRADGTNRMMIASFPVGVEEPVVAKKVLECAKQNRPVAKMTALVEIVKRSEFAAKVTYMVQIDSPTSSVIDEEKQLQRQLALEVRKVTETVRHYFQRERELKDYDNGDGLIIGEKLASLKEFEFSGSSEQWVEKVINEHAGMRQLCDLYAWLPELLQGMLSMWLKAPVAVASKLDNVTELEASFIGSSLATSLKSRKVADNGVDEWTSNYVSIEELCKRHPFFWHLAVGIGAKKLRSAPWGLIYRVCFGAFISLLDVSTDTVAVVRFFQKGQTAYAVSMLLMIVLSITLQALLLLIQYRQKSRLRKLQELIPVFLCVKPAVDAYRLAAGLNENDEELTFAPYWEIIFCKLLEITAEALPGSLLQSYAYLRSNRSSWSPVFSILSSALVIGYGTVIVSFDIDCNHAARAARPDFFGYIPYSYEARTIIFVVMVIMSSTVIFVKLLGTVLLAAVGPTAVVLYFVVDVVVFYAVKLVRSDIRYYMKVDAILLSVVVRLVQKLLTDFTGMIVSRHPCECGGAYWLFNIISTQILSFVWISLYDSQYHGENKAPTYLLYTVLGLLEIVFLLCVFLFLRTMDQRFIPSFYSTTTAKQFIAESFLYFDDADIDKIRIFKFHPSMYSSINVEVKEWLESRLHEWHEQKPDFFTPALISSIPKYLMPSEVNDEFLPGSKNQQSGKYYDAAGDSNDSSDDTGNGTATS